MDASFPDLPDDIEALKAALVVERERRVLAEADAAVAQARLSADQALIAHLKLQIEKMRRELFGPRSERMARLLDQMELQLEELEATASEDDLAAERAARKAGTTNVSAFTRQRPSRKPFPEHLPRDCQESCYGDQERHTGPASLRARSEGGVLQGRAFR